jgi:hypothetical protein
MSDGLPIVRGFPSERCIARLQGPFDAIRLQVSLPRTLDSAAAAAARWDWCVSCEPRCFRGVQTSLSPYSN